MKYRLDSVRKNKTRLKRRFISSSPKKKTSIPRKKKRAWLLPALIGSLYLLFLGYILWHSMIFNQEIATLKNNIRQFESNAKTIIKETRETIIKEVPVVKEEPKPKIIKKNTSDCYTARRGGQYYTDCNWK